MTSPTAPAAAIAARRRQTERKLADVQTAIAQLRRESGQLTITTIARRAAVSSTFLYENPEARALCQNAVAATHARRAQCSADDHDRIEATWRERALNAEEGLTRRTRRSGPNAPASERSWASSATRRRPPAAVNRSRPWSSKTPP
ncbi:DUF6262 family protein [Streptomyces griseofuscus]|uniref:DUF6262 family protein n=1 Tax=Streptomyces griseofuscus TaxID=146922 RepID=UPI001FAC6DA8|nr:DUF6262 family protein [Streptomyces griseofuscus]